MPAVCLKTTCPGPGRVERALAGALAHALRLALANRHSRTVRGAAALLSAEDEADVAEAFAALPAGGAAGSAKEARAAHTALVGHVARRLRDAEAAREPADLGACRAGLTPKACIVYCMGLWPAGLAPRTTRPTWVRTGRSSP